MAIYQYNIDFIPQQAVIDRHGQIPTQLFIDNDAHGKQWEKDDESDYEFEDALSIRWWDKVRAKFSDVESFIDSFTTPIEWSKNQTDSRSYGNNDTNDMYFSLTPDGFIEEFGCRIDLHDFDRNFIDNVLTLAKRLDCLLMDRKGNLLKPDIDKLVVNIKTPNSFMFVSNSTDFLDKLSSGQIKPE